MEKKDNIIISGRFTEKEAVELVVPFVSVSRGNILCDTLKQGEIQYIQTLNCQTM